MKYMIFNVAVAGALIYLVIGNDPQNAELATVSMDQDDIPVDEVYEVSQPIDREQSEEDLPLIEVSTPITHKPVLEEVVAQSEKVISQENDRIQFSQSAEIVEEIQLMTPQTRQKELDKLVQSLELMFLEQTN